MADKFFVVFDETDMPVAMFEIFSAADKWVKEQRKRLKNNMSFFFVEMEKCGNGFTTNGDDHWPDDWH